MSFFIVIISEISPQILTEFLNGIRTIAPEENCPGLELGFGLVSGLVFWDNFSRG